jgi:hypothetical protein
MCIISLQVIGVPLGSTGVTRLEAHAFVLDEQKKTNNSFERRNSFTAPALTTTAIRQIRACLRPHFVNDLPFLTVFRVTGFPKYFSNICSHSEGCISATLERPHPTTYQATCSLLLLGHRGSGASSYSRKDSAQ